MLRLLVVVASWQRVRRALRAQYASTATGLTTSLVIDGGIIILRGCIIGVFACVLKDVMLFK